MQRGTILVTTLLALPLAWNAAGAQAPTQAQSQAPAGSAARAPQTDQTVAVSRGARLTIENMAGEVVVRAWNRDAVRVQARHSSRARVSVRTVASGVEITASGSYGPAGAVDYEISVPVWIPVKVDGTYAYISIEGTQNEISAESVRGDIVIKGGGTFVSGKSVEGEVVIEDARGRIAASSINQGISVSGASGDIAADTVNGPIKLTRIESASVDATTVNGHITYDGNAAPQGRYRFSTHNGNIVVAVPETAKATFVVRTYNGGVNANLPVEKSGELRRGRRATYTLGGGGAEFELESFGGTVHLRRTESAAKSKAQE